MHLTQLHGLDELVHVLDLTLEVVVLVLGRIVRHPGGELVYREDAEPLAQAGYVLAPHVGAVSIGRPEPPAVHQQDRFPLALFVVPRLDTLDVDELRLEAADGSRFRGSLSLGVTAHAHQPRDSRQGKEGTPNECAKRTVSDRHHSSFLRVIGDRRIRSWRHRRCFPTRCTAPPGGTGRVGACGRRLEPDRHP